MSRYVPEFRRNPPIATLLRVSCTILCTSPLVETMLAGGEGGDAELVQWVEVTLSKESPDGRQRPYVPNHMILAFQKEER